jgi:hypothetical protein
MVHKLNSKNKYVKMYAVVYGGWFGTSGGEDVNSETFELFGTLAEAKKFATKNKGSEIFSAELKRDRIFKEEGSWNYDDKSDLAKNIKSLKTGETRRFL